MLKNAKILFILFFVFPVFIGCGTKVIKTELDQLFEKDFEGLTIPEINKIKEEGMNKSFPYASFDKVWDSAITILIQEGIVVRVSKDTGTIITITNPPLAVCVDRGDVVNVYLDYMYNLYKEAGNPKAVASEGTQDLKEKRAKSFFDKLATQLYAEEKWKYLINS